MKEGNGEAMSKDEYAGLQPCVDTCGEIIKLKGTNTTCKKCESVWSPEGYMVVRCCRRTIELDQFTNTCDECETDYNMEGMRLLARRLWE